MASPKYARLSRPTLKVHVGATPTKAKMVQWGAQMDDTCGLRGRWDTFEGRLWHCSGAAEARGRLPASFRSDVNNESLRAGGHFRVPTKDRE